MYKPFGLLISQWPGIRFSKICSMFAKLAFKIKVLIIYKLIQWKYQLTKQNWPVCEFQTLLQFNRLWFQNLPSDPKSYRAFREMDPWPLNIEARLEMTLTSAYYLYGNFDEKFLSTGITGIFVGTEKRNGIESYHLENTGKFFAFSRHEAWH